MRREVRISVMRRISSKSGKLVMVQVSSDRIAAAMILSAAFFAPFTAIVPDSLLPPSIRYDPCILNIVTNRWKWCKSWLERLALLCYTTIMKFNKLPNLTRFIASAPLPPWRRILSKLALVSIIIVSFLAGFYTARPDVGFSTKKFGSVIERDKQAPNFLSQDVSFDMFWDVWQLINREYVDRPVPDIKLYYGALAGLVAGVGDPYTVFLDPKVAKEFNTDLSGSFEGIGRSQH